MPPDLKRLGRLDSLSSTVLYLTHTPGPPLGEFVDYLWLLRHAPSHSRERVLPSGTFELVVNLHDNEFRIGRSERPEAWERYSGAMLSGPYGGSFAIDTENHASIMGVHFRPGGAFPFLDPPARDLADVHLDLEILWGRSVVELRERLCEAAGPEERFRLMEAALAAHVIRSLRHHGAVSIALQEFEQGGGSSIRGLARKVGLSQRRFIQVFKDEVGLSPKRFARVKRFRNALGAIPAAGDPDWAGLAAECGYFDQAHLIHEFHAFSGFKPSEYLRHRNERVKDHHVALAD